MSSNRTVETPKHTRPSPGIDHDPTGQPAALPDPDDLAALDQLQLTPADDSPPWLPHHERDSTDWTWLAAAEAVPF